MPKEFKVRVEWWNFLWSLAIVVMSVIEFGWWVILPLFLIQIKVSFN